VRCSDVILSVGCFTSQLELLIVDGVECPSKKKLLLQISKDYRHAVLDRNLPNKFCRLMRSRRVVVSARWRFVSRRIQHLAEGLRGWKMRRRQTIQAGGSRLRLARNVTDFKY